MAADANARPSANEHTPLLPENKQNGEQARQSESVVRRILLCAFMVSLSFAVTQVPLVYVFRVMTCQAYYDTHPSPPLDVMTDRCSIPEVEASTAKALALVGGMTTLFGLINLFVTGWTIKKIGIKGALLIQVFWPAVRLLVQNVGVEIGKRHGGGNLGIIIVQCSQIITIIGGPNGYLLALNSFITEVTEHEQRTPALGRLQGAMFFGTSIGYLVGGELSERFGISSPFQITLGLFCLSTLYVFLSLPWVEKPEATHSAGKAQGIRRFFGPLKLFAPQKWVLADGRIQREFGPILLAAGVFLGILATSYIPILLQMYSTNVFGFGTRENGYLISLNSLLRGAFLTFIFPRLIAIGRKKMSRRADPKAAASIPSSGLSTPVGVVNASTIETTDAMDNEQEPLQPPQRQSKQETFDFDLVYARYSLLLDGTLTGTATFVQHGWQIYLVGIVLPFAAGTASASKGAILQMCDASERVDALSAITLVENMARLTTNGIFGFIFAAFASIEKTNLVFAINGAVALLGFSVLLFARFPPKGSQRLDDFVDEDD